ncbi:glucose-1-phosphate cytidylyltransferase [Marinisporobacter balticus]|uniref:Glucose-1-phosphate cytidylyltransferase n=1 Tax=Marinisporobacter balticus TaxID=2018667 RepID=A0A4R2KWX8_9FIRM|nr:glucose-1-phosphate cytidylyltransferase [Marinisporobacter balticus]TCO79061.1 glucose-1-phosphate cytidylyltransferase [Marinisporobacter balticus]
MKVAILCGGKGSRMKEITDDIPKPLAEIDNKPILWHIMKTYMYYGLNDFILLLGYKGDKIKEYFMHYHWKNHNFLLDGEQNNIKMLEKSEQWKVTFVDTGIDTMTGGRIKQAEKYIKDDTFMLTYGDGLADINLNKLLDFHKKNGCIGTVTGVKKINQYGTVSVKKNIAQSFQEKPSTEEIINGGFFVLNREIFSYIKNDRDCTFEKEPLVNLTNDKQLAVYLHKGFWTAMDTYKDLLQVNEMWKNNKATWKVW